MTEAAAAAHYGFNPSPSHARVITAVQVLPHIVHLISATVAVMIRTAVRRFAASAVRSAEAHAPSSHLIEIAKAQRIATGGFIDGM